jgi:MFS family permease
LSSALSNQQFMDWGWRCAFLVSIVLLGVGLFIRLTLVETPEFARIRGSYHVSRLPLLDVVRDDGRAIVLGLLARMGEGAIFTIYSLYMLSYLTAVIHLSRTLVLGAVTAAGLVLVVTTPLAAAWSDRVGRRLLFALASLVHGALAFPLMALLSSGDPALAALAIVLAVGVLWAPIYGPEAALLCELFATRVRYTGVSVVYQLGAIIFLAPLPILATLLVGWDGNQPWYLAGYVALGCTVSAGAAWLMGRRNGSPGTPLDH